MFIDSRIVPQMVKNMDSGAFDERRDFSRATPLAVLFHPLHP
jgi:hypothetical protein